MNKKHLIIEGLLAGVVICEAIAIIRMRKSDGILRIDRTSDEVERYKFEIDNLDMLAKRKFMTLKIDNNATLSQN